MDINATAKEYGNGVITSLKKNRRILIMMLLFAAGMIIGAVSLKRADSYLSGAFSDMFSVYKIKGQPVSRHEFYKFAGCQRRIYARSICIRAVCCRAAADMHSTHNTWSGDRYAVGLSILKFCSARAWVLRFGDISRAYTGYFCASSCLQCRNKFII